MHSGAQVEVESEEMQAATNRKYFFSVRGWLVHGTNFLNMLLTLLRSTLLRSH